MRFRLFALVVLGTTTSLGGCTPALPPAPPLKVPTLELRGSKCSIAKSQSEPLVVDWSSVDRARLEALSRSGAVPVQYSGCELKILPACSLPASTYRYVGTTKKHDEDHIKNADELYAKIPLGAARFEGTLARAGELSIGMTVVGRYQLDQSVKKADLTGDCGEATHIISALTVGAFAFTAGARAKVAGEASAFGATVGGGNESQRDVLTQDGSDVACDQAAAADTRAPAGCGALIRVELRVLPETAAKVELEAAERVMEETRREAETKSAASGRTLSYILGGAGLVLVGGGVGAFAMSSSAKQSINDGSLATGQDIESAESRAQTFQGVSIGAFVVGGLSLVAATVIYLNSSPPSAATPDAGGR